MLKFRQVSDAEEPDEKCTCGLLRSCVSCHVQSPRQPPDLFENVTSPRHRGLPCLRVGWCKGRGLGLFAGSSIRRRAKVTNYGGRVRTAPFPTGRRWKSHARTLDKMHTVLDGRYGTWENLVFMVRHHHLGSLCNAPSNEKEKPNVEFYDIDHRGGFVTPFGDPTIKTVGIRALRDIGAGEELILSYGKRYWSER